jgi:flagellar hook-associated protein 1 FlgK
MIDLLSLGLQGVKAYQAALAVTGDNVANAETPGFSRRSVRLAAGPGGTGTILQRLPVAGSGVLTEGMVRAGDALLTNAARTAAGDHARLEVRADWLTRLQSTLTGATIDARLSGLFDAATDLAAAPTSVAARAIFLDRADQAATGIRTLGDSLARLEQDIDTAVRLTAIEVNGLTAALQRVNEELRRTQSSTAPSLALLDERDQLLAELAARLRIHVTEGKDGGVTVRLGSSPAGAILVPEFGNAIPVSAENGPSGPDLILDPTHSATRVRLPASGQLHGLLEAGAEVARQRDSLDTLATRFATELNRWHQQGTDLAGNPGQPLLTTTTLLPSPGRANAGTATLDVEIADLAPLSPTGYTLLANAGGFTLARADGSASITGPGPLTLDGVTIRPGPGAQPGDSFTLAPVSGARGLALRPLAPAQVAVAARFTTDADVLNTGTARLTAELDSSAAAFAAPPPLQLRVTGPGTLDVIDPATSTVLATLPFTPGQRLEGDGFAFTLTGAPQPGDSFRLLATGAASADTANIRALARIRTATGPDGTLETAHDVSLASLGTRLSETTRLAAAARAIRDDAARAADAISGIDLDREAAELTRLQMAYRANAQVIATARALFDTILGVAG